MIREKKQGENFGVSGIVFVVFLSFPESKKKSSTLKHALVSNNKESIIESKIMRLS